MPGPSRSWDPAPAALSLRRSPCPCASCSCYPRSLGSSRSRESASTNRIVDLAVPAWSPSANMVAGARETKPMTAAGAWKAEADVSTARSCRVGTHRCVSEYTGRSGRLKKRNSGEWQAVSSKKCPAQRINCSLFGRQWESSLILVFPPYCFCATGNSSHILQNPLKLHHFPATSAPTWLGRY